MEFIDSTPIAVCHNKRISRHKVFQGSAGLGKTTKGWFFGFKLHLICNSQGELCSIQITPGNRNDIIPVEKMTIGMMGKLFGDKGYMDKGLFKSLFNRGLQLIRGIRKNMKKLLSVVHKLLLRKRSGIESTNNQLRNVFHLEHSRHRSAFNGFANILAAVIAYIFHPNKAKLKFSEQYRRIFMTT